MLQVLRGTWHVAELQPILIVLWWAQHCGSGRLGFAEVCLTPSCPTVSHLVLPCPVSQSEQMEIVGLSVRGTPGWNVRST